MREAKEYRRHWSDMWIADGDQWRECTREDAMQYGLFCYVTEGDASAATTTPTTLPPREAR